MIFSVNKTYTFNTLVPAILGLTYKNVTVAGVVDYRTACSFIQPDQMHAAIYPHLPTGTVDDCTKYDYLLLDTEAGGRTCLAVPWINTASVAIVSNESLRVVVKGADANDVTKIRNALIVLGYPDFTIEVI